MCNLPKNHDHMSVYCGGFGPQHNTINMGRCAICGDEFSTPNKVNGLDYTFFLKLKIVL